MQKTHFSKIKHLKKKLCKKEIELCQPNKASVTSTLKTPRGSYQTEKEKIVNVYW